MPLVLLWETAIDVFVGNVLSVDSSLATCWRPFAILAGKNIFMSNHFGKLALGGNNVGGFDIIHAMA